jgi:hypothetical protein
VILRIGKHIPSDGANGEDHDDGVTMVMIKSSDLEKEKEKNKKFKAKVKLDKSFCALGIKTPSGCDHI